MIFKNNLVVVEILIVLVVVVSVTRVGVLSYLYVVIFICDVYVVVGVVKANIAVTTIPAASCVVCTALGILWVVFFDTTRICLVSRGGHLANN